MDTDMLARLFVTWILPGILCVVVGFRKGRGDLGVVMALLFGALGFFIGLGLGWLGFIVVCCFPKREPRR